MNMRDIESRARANSGKAVKFAKSNTPTLSVLSDEINEDLAKVQYTDNKVVYFDIGEFTYSIIKQNDAYVFAVKHNSAQAKENVTLENVFELQDDAPVANKVSSKSASKQAPVSFIEANLPIIMIALLILSVLIVGPVILKLI